jgi:uncharacterized membrane protein
MNGGIRFYSGGALTVFAVVLLLVLVILLIPLLILGMIGAAFTRLGFSWIAAVAVILFMLLGSFVNIPVYRIRRDVIRVAHDDAHASGNGALWAPREVWDTTISVNLGGAVIPVCISLFLLYRAILITGTSLFVPVCTGILLVALIAFVSTRLVTGIGLRVPLIIPGLTALFTGLLFFSGTGLSAAVTAFAGGTLGTLIGGNIAQLFRIRDLDVPDVSIGGAGTFGAVFLCCLLPALIA